jgi:hypothetical protein
MDHLRRAIVLSMPLAGSAGLLGCQGQDAPAPGQAAALSDMAQAAALPLNQAARTAALTISPASGRSLSAYFNGKADQGTNAFRPDLALLGGCLKGKGTRLALRLRETITRADGSGIYRTLSLTLSSQRALRAGTRLSLTTADAVKGKLIVQADDPDIHAHYVVAGSGQMALMPALLGGSPRLLFDRVRLLNQATQEAIHLVGVLPLTYVVEEEPTPFG